MLVGTAKMRLNGRGAFGKDFIQVIQVGIEDLPLFFELCFARYKHLIFGDDFTCPHTLHGRQGLF